jgi:hypothetical protein
MAWIWAIVGSAHPQMLDVVRQIFVMVGENRRLSSWLDGLKAERARLQAELGNEVRGGSGVQGGGGAGADAETSQRPLGHFH